MSSGVTPPAVGCLAASLVCNDAAFGPFPPFDVKDGNKHIRKHDMPHFHLQMSTLDASVVMQERLLLTVYPVLKQGCSKIPDQDLCCRLKTHL